VSDASDGVSRLAGQPQPARPADDVAEVVPVDDGSYGVAEPETVVHVESAAESPRGAPPPQSSRSPEPSAGAMMRQAEELLKPVDAFFANPQVYRIAGYVSAGLSLLTFVVSVLLSYWQRTWYTGAVLFALTFLIAEAAAAILAALRRIESRC
jgi:hypothetical protein